MSRKELYDEESALAGQEGMLDAIQAIATAQREQQVCSNDLQRQIDMLRLTSAELIGRSQSSSATLDKFKDVAQCSTEAAKHLEAEILEVRSCCQSTREATMKEMSAFRAELEESRSKHFADVAELCASFAAKAGMSEQLVPPMQGQDAMLSMVETRERNLRDQMSQLLEASQAALSKRFLEEHRKLLVEILEEREMRMQDTQQMRGKFDAVLNALQRGDLNIEPSLINGDCIDGDVTAQLQSMREAIRELRASMDDETSGGVPSSKQSYVRSDGAETWESVASERPFFEELTKLRETLTHEIESCLEAANAAVRLGEHLANELNIEVQARCTDVKELRRLFELRAPKEMSNEDLLLNHSKSPVKSTPPMVLQPKHEEPLSFQDKIRFGGSASPFLGLRDGAGSMTLAPALRRRADGLDTPASGIDPKFGHSMASLPGASVQQGVVAGSQKISIGAELGAASPGIMLSGGACLAPRQHNLPAGDRPLPTQWSQLGSANTRNSVASPRPARVHSPLRMMQRVDMPAQVGQVTEHQLTRRQQQGNSPLRESRDGITPSFSQQVAVQAGYRGSGVPSSAAMPPGTARRVVNGGEILARSVSPFQRRASLT